ncbi:YihY family inner membrane protein [Legionella sp. W05-934-2]|jgi:membrane protein|uniref:YihY family inner membrane protein n=1 Tax=Legionella sp. W05-934-2 TaxID=1198649 RepID=UPI0034635131
MTINNIVLQKFADSTRFIRFVIYHFFEDDCTYRASALAFTTLLALVPLMSVGLSILSTFPVFESFREPIQDFIFTNFVPATGKALQTYLAQFTNQVSQLSTTGVTFLVITAILLLVTIENAMNQIWRVSSPRGGVSAFLLYWTILSLSPVLLGLSMVASSYVLSMPYLQAHKPPIFLWTGLPFLLSFVGFSFLYIVVPNCKTKIANGLWGGLTAAILFETAKQGFAWYLSRYSTYQLLYGAFAIVPIFFIWIYWVWVVTLIGAEISYALSMSHLRRRGEALDPMTHALIWLYRLWEAQHSGKGVSLQRLIDADSQPYSLDAKQMIKILEEGKYIHTNDKGDYFLSRSLDNMPLYQVGEQLPFHFPRCTLPLPKKPPKWLAQWYQIIEARQKETQQKLSISVDSLFRGS